MWWINLWNSTWILHHPLIKPINNGMSAKMERFSKRYGRPVSSSLVGVYGRNEMLKYSLANHVQKAKSKISF